MNKRFVYQFIRAVLFAPLTGMVVMTFVVATAPLLASAQGWRCTPIVQPSGDDAHAPPKRVQRCVGEGPDSDERNPPVESKPLPPAVKRVLPPDANREERLLRERLHRALRNQQRGTPGSSAECESVVDQIAEQQPLMRSLRTDTRRQARDRFNVLANEFRERGC